MANSLALADTGNLGMTDYGILILAVLGVVLTGRSLLTLIDRICGTLQVPRTACEVWGVSILMGISFTAAAGFVWSDMGRPLNTAFAWKQWAVGGTLGLLATIQAWRRQSAGGATSGPPQSADSSSPFLTRTFRISLGLILTGAVVVSFVPPIDLSSEEDEPPAPHADRVELTRKTAVLIQTGSIDSPPLNPAGGYPYHFREPLMLPLAERHLSALLGRPSELTSVPWSPLCLTGLACGFLGILSRRTTPAWGAILTTGLIVMPALWSPTWGIPARIADLPLTCFQGVAVILLWDALQEPPGRIRVRSLLLAAGMASSACFTKAEGLVILEAMGIAWCLALFPQSLTPGSPASPPSSTRRRDLAGLAIFLLFSAFLLTPWMKYRHELPVTADSLRYQQLSPASLKTHLTQLELLPDLFWLVARDWWRTGVVWGLLLAAVISAPRRTWARSQRFVLGVLLVSTGIAEFILTPAGLKPHLRGSLQVWLLHQTPLAVLLIAAAWSPAKAQATAGQPSAVPLN